MSALPSDLAAVDVDVFVRATGFATFALSWLAVFAGATITSRAGRSLSPARISIELHRQASALALAFGALHGVVLLALKGRVPWPGVAPELDAGWLALAIFAAGAASYAARALLGPRAWRRVHALAYIGFVSGLVHALSAGGDAGSIWAQGLWLAAVTSVVFVSVWRLLAVRPALPAA